MPSEPWLSPIPLNPDGHVDAVAISAILNEIDAEQDRASIGGAQFAIFTGQSMWHKKTEVAELDRTPAVYAYLTLPKSPLPNAAIKVGHSAAMATRYNTHLSAGLAKTLMKHSGVWPFLGSDVDLSNINDARDFIRRRTYLVIFPIDKEVDEWRTRMKRIEVCARAYFRPLTEGAGGRSGKNPTNLELLTESISARHG